MILVTVMYPAEDGISFDERYYVDRHMPLVKQRWSPLGLEHAQVVRGAGTPDGSEPPFRAMAILTFTSLEAFGAAAKAHGREIFADIPNFTNVQPQVQINEPMGEG